MPRKPIAGVWREAIRGIAINDPKAGPAEIERQLNGLGARIGRGDAPSQRTISRVASEARGRDFDQAPYRACTWPESMERGDLPWEASGALLELLTYLNGAERLSPYVRGQRPLVNAARWFWRVTQARPLLSVVTRWHVATSLTVGKLSGHEPLLRQSEWWLANLSDRRDAEAHERMIAITKDRDRPAEELEDVLEELEVLAAKSLNKGWFGMAFTVEAMDEELARAADALGTDAAFESLMGVAFSEAVLKKMMNVEIIDSAEVEAINDTAG